MFNYQKISSPINLLILNLFCYLPGGPSQNQKNTKMIIVGECSVSVGKIIITIPRERQQKVMMAIQIYVRDTNTGNEK